MGEFLLELFNCCTAFLVKFPREVFSSEAYEGNDDVGVAKNEMSVEVAESQKGLHILDSPWFRPI